MGDIAIRAEKLSKLYRIGRRQEAYKTLRDALAEAAAAPFRRVAAALRGESSLNQDATTLALDDVSFEVPHGEAIGIIGRNGAGKTTLLKILSRITQPTSGYAEIYGRVGSLLEVGTGFHPELTGRENIYLNGAILGMRRREIERKFDEMVAFAEVEEFIDTPVKHYSSGMYLRLAFAVAAHLEPEILLVDEVLAVGDVDFQRRCLGKMGDITRGGRTVVFVSHNMAAIGALCTLAMLIDRGRVVAIGKPDEVVNRYLAQVGSRAGIPLTAREDRTGDGRLRFTRFAVLDRHGAPITVAQTGQEVTFELTVDVRDGAALRTTAFQISFLDSLGQRLFILLTRPSGDHFSGIKQGDRIRCHVPFLPLLAGTYLLHLISKDALGELDVIREAVELQVAAGDMFGTGKSLKSDGGSIAVPHRWSKVSR